MFGCSCKLAWWDGRVPQSLCIAVYSYFTSGHILYNYMVCTHQSITCIINVLLIPEAITSFFCVCSSSWKWWKYLGWSQNWESYHLRLSLLHRLEDHCILVKCFPLMELCYCFHINIWTLNYHCIILHVLSGCRPKN